MRDTNSAALPADSAPVVPPHKDRSTGLVVFGILTILLGCIAGLMMLMMVVQFSMVASTNPQLPFSMMVPAVSIYGVLAVALVWLGIGSIMARRWARALLLIFSWSWLFVGVIAIISLAVMLPRVFDNLSNGTSGQPALNAAMKNAIMAFAFVFYGVVFVILPSVWTFFFHSPHVKATCAVRDPVPCWTDACPLPVLAVSLWLLFSVPMLLLMPLTGLGVMPFFGTFLSGGPGAVFCVAMAALWSYAAWSVYKLDPRGWWLMVIALGLVMVSALLTFARHDITEMYRLMNYPEAMLEQLKKTGLLAGNNFEWVMIFAILPFLGYLLYIKKYFHRPA